MKQSIETAILVVLPAVVLVLYVWSRNFGFVIDAAATVVVRLLIALGLALMVTALQRAVTTDTRSRPSFAFRRVTLIWVNVIVIVHILVSLWLG